MTERWKLLPQERDRLRNIIGMLLLGPEYKPKEPLIKQLQPFLTELRGGRPGLLGFLAGSNSAPSKEEYPMPPDYAGGPEGWAKLSELEKRAIHEALKIGRKIYVAKSLEEGKRAMLDSDILMGHKLKNMLKQF